MPVWGDLPYEYGEAPYGFGPYGGDLLIVPYDLPPLLPGPASIATPQAALNARYTQPVRTVYVAGVTVMNTGVTHRHRVGETATGRISMLLPRHGVVEPLAEVEIQGGVNDLVGTQFSGYIPTWEGAMTSRGNLLDVEIVGWSQLLHEPLRDDLVFPGPVAADAVFVALCQLVGVPSYRAEVATTVAGDPLMLGGNNAVDDGAFIIKALQSPLSQFQRVVSEYGYFVTDFPDGTVVFHHVYGLPTGDPVVTFTEGLHLGTARRGYDVRGIVNVWDINGVTYEDEYGGRIVLRSIADPDEVEPHPDIRGGYRYERKQNSDIVRQDQADAIRARYELDYSAASAPVKWEAVALPGVNPGDCVQVESSTVEASGTLWLTGIEIDNDNGGYTASYEGRAGAGEALPGIEDRIEIPIQTAAVHLGDEFRSNYAHPATQGVEKVWTFTLPSNVSVANIRGEGHGWNSQVIGGVQTDLEVTKWAVWQHGVDRTNRDNQPISSGNMPVMNEELSTNWATKPEWPRFAVNLRTIDAGEYDLVLTCGVKAGTDDGEVRNAYLECYGTTEAAGAA